VNIGAAVFNLGAAVFNLGAAVFHKGAAVFNLGAAVFNLGAAVFHKGAAVFHKGAAEMRHSKRVVGDRVRSFCFVFFVFVSAFSCETASLHKTSVSHLQSTSS